MLDVKLAFIYWNPFWVLSLFLSREGIVGGISELDRVIFQTLASLAQWEDQPDLKIKLIVLSSGSNKNQSLPPKKSFALRLEKNTSSVFDPCFKGLQSRHRTYAPVIGRPCSQQINTAQASLLSVLFLFLCILLIDLPWGGDSSDSDTKQVPKENISFKG